ncbi:MAG: prolyl-tRNA synthetase [Weeksellaceae bacterium]|nr:prolyl-tRNA synthetase [Weeksellaceae bacterium]
MKNINNTRFLNLLKSKALILIASSSLLTSCVIYTGGYSETDGVYYDPNKDSLPAGSYSGNYGNKVDDYYSYQETNPSLYDNNQQNIQDQQNAYKLSSDSDWGSYTGTETTYTNFNNWGYSGWGMGFGYGGFGGWGYPGYGFYGWNSPFNSWGWGFGFGWGNSFYSPWGWGGGFYDPFWGYGYGGWGGYYGGYYRPIYYNRSGGNGGRLTGMISQNRSGSRNDSRFNGINSSGFHGSRDIRNQLGTSNSSIRTSGMRNSANGVRTNNGMIRNYPNNGGIRNNYPNTGGTRTQNYPNDGGVRTAPNNGGFRNDSYSSPSRSGNYGGFNSGGGMRSGGSSGGGGEMRSGGGGRR